MQERDLAKSLLPRPEQPLLALLGLSPCILVPHAGDPGSRWAGALRRVGQLEGRTPARHRQEERPHREICQPSLHMGQHF